MASSSAGEEAKARGNAAYAAGDYDAAVKHFTEAISVDPTNHVFYSNRSAAYSSLNDYSAALDDAQTTVSIKPCWPKSYFRLGSAHLGLNHFDQAVASYVKGLDLDPTNPTLRYGLSEARRAAASTPSSSPFTGMFSGPDMWAKLRADPTTRGFLEQPDFVRMLIDVSQNSKQMGFYVKDLRMQQALGVLIEANLSQNSSLSPFPTEASEEPEPEPKDDEDAVEKAQREKEAGNGAYKKKDFDNAIKHYTKAIQLNDQDISFLTNRAAVFLETAQYEECVKDCDKAVERGRELRSDYKMVARALTRKGTALVKMAKCSKDFDLAIEAFQKALTEHRNPDTLKKLNDAQKSKKELEQQEYSDPILADQECETGNELFKQRRYPEAVKHYTESLRRNTDDPEAYSNRAACYIRLRALPEGLKDAEKCIELDPTFVNGYIVKGTAQLLVKDYDNALGTYQLGLKHDPNNSELMDGVKRCVQQINKASRGDISAGDLQERQVKGMQDPEIQNILSDPVMRQVLTDFQENPKAAQEHTKNPMVMSKIQKLASAGIVPMK